jgi:hypothetical protein
MRIALVFVFAISLPAASGDAKKIGVVKHVEGKWCRKTTSIKKGEALYWEDDVRYCSRPFVKKHKIIVRFDRVPPYERTYRCSTPGICDQQAKLWLQGAYQYGPGASGQLTPLISRPKVVSSNIPDAVIRAGQDGVMLSEDIVSAVAGHSITICRILSGDKPTNCTQDNPTELNPTIRVGPLLPLGILLRDSATNK